MSHSQGKPSVLLCVNTLSLSPVCAGFACIVLVSLVGCTDNQFASGTGNAIVSSTDVYCGVRYQDIFGPHSSCENTSLISAAETFDSKEVSRTAGELSDRSRAYPNSSTYPPMRRLRRPLAHGNPSATGEQRIAPRVHADLSARLTQGNLLNDQSTVIDGTNTSPRMLFARRGCGGRTRSSSYRGSGSQGSNTGHYDPPSVRQLEQQTQTLEVNRIREALDDAPSEAWKDVMRRSDADLNSRKSVFTIRNND